jgi:hypothetical protein
VLVVERSAVLPVFVEEQVRWGQDAEDVVEQLAVSAVGAEVVVVVYQEAGYERW